MTLTLAQAAGLPARTGRFVSLPRIVWRAEDKRRVAADTGAVALDMESAVIGAEAAERRIPFAVIRAVSDLLDEDLHWILIYSLRPAIGPKAYGVASLVRAICLGWDGCACKWVSPQNASL